MQDKKYKHNHRHNWMSKKGLNRICIQSNIQQLDWIADIKEILCVYQKINKIKNQKVQHIIYGWIKKIYNICRQKTVGTVDRCKIKTIEKVV